MGLTSKEEKFIYAYAETGNGSEAARRAGYKTSRPDQQAYELLRKPEIATEIQKAKKGLQELFKERAAEALETLLQLMRSSRRDSVRFQAARDILDRAGYRPDEIIHLTAEERQKQEINEKERKRLSDDFTEFLKKKYGKGTHSPAHIEKNGSF